MFNGHYIYLVGRIMSSKVARKNTKRPPPQHFGRGGVDTPICQLLEILTYITQQIVEPEKLFTKQVWIMTIAENKYARKLYHKKPFWSRFFITLFLVKGYFQKLYCSTNCCGTLPSPSLILFPLDWSCLWSNKQEVQKNTPENITKDLLICISQPFS